MHIIGLSVTGFKRISAVHIEPKEGKPVILRGDNEAGKSSIIQAIEYAITSCGAVNPIRKGENKCKITLELGDKEVDLIVEKTITNKGGDSLVLKDATGAQIPKPQTFLNALFRQITIDPLAFMAMKAKEQAQALCDQLGLTEKMAALDEEVETMMGKNRLKKQEVKSLETRRDAIAPAGRNVPDELVDVAAIIADIKNCSSVIEGHEQAVRDCQADTHELKRAEDEVTRLEKELKKAKANVTERKKAVDLREKHAEELRANADEKRALVPQLQDKLATSTETNESVRQKKERAKLSLELLDAERAQDKLAGDIEKKREEKMRLVRDAKLPIDGLTLTADGLEYQDVPLQDLNTASQIRVCAALAMAEKPKLRILFIREAALCNKENLQIILDIAKEKDFQCWMEVFMPEDDGSEGLFIESGEVAAIDGKAV